MDGTLSINEDSRHFRDWTDSDLAAAVERRGHDKVPICVSVQFEAKCGPIHFVSPACKVGGGGRPSNECEKHYLDIWNRYGLNSPSISAKGVVAFFREVARR